MASITINETGVRLQVTVYRNLNGVGPGETQVQISGWAEHDGPAEIPMRRLMDEDITPFLTPAQKATFDQIATTAENWLKNRWNIT